MPTRNRENFIGDAITSLVAQSISDWEVIVVDDHSEESDETERIVRNFSDSRIVYHTLPDCHGRNASSARNFGNAVSRAPIIAVADSDDIFYSDRARATLEAFKSTQCDVFYSDFDIWDDVTAKEISKGARPVVPFDISTLKVYDFIPHGSVAYRRDLALQYPYNSFMTRSADYDLFSRLAVAGKRFHFCPRILYRYRLHSGNLIRQYDATLFDRFIKQSRGWESFDPALISALVVDLERGI